MRAWFNRIFMGRQGMDELSKALFWAGLVCFLLAGPAGLLLPGLGGLFSTLFFFLLLMAFVRAFSRRLAAREAENAAYLRFLEGRKRAFRAWQDRFRQRKNYRFFRCPGCKAMLRVPRGKGKIHIQCKCGYVLYRKT